ncbi:hypothetical protein ACTXT7_016131 [Hymenolepis weldensis]
MKVGKLSSGFAGKGYNNWQAHAIYSFPPKNRPPRSSLQNIMLNKIGEARFNVIAKMIVFLTDRIDIIFSLAKSFIYGHRHSNLSFDKFDLRRISGTTTANGLETKEM